MNMIEDEEYCTMLRRMVENFPYWDKLAGRAILISGASGMLGSLLVDAVMIWNKGRPSQEKCNLIGLVRNRAKAEARFAPWLNVKGFCCMQHDICEPLPELERVPDYWIHAASTTHPAAYSTEPINTIMSNVLGTKNMLDKVSELGGRLLLLSSVEIYGENRGDVERFTEDYCGYINCNTLRAGYPEAKRVSEAMCQAYIAERGADAVIIRLPRCYGPTMQMTDTKAVAQFIKNAVRGENIVLKSEGKQLYSYAHAVDAVSGILWVILDGKTGEAYNLADEESDIMLKDLAQISADSAGTKVVFDLPDEIEKRGFSKAQKALLDGGKLKKLGWRPGFSIQSGISETITVLRECRNG